jgi:hypothetical protein
MFTNNKYTTLYYNIINNRKINPIIGYTEKHHIIPKSLGGSNKKENLVNLSAREHFICHRLLVKMTTGRDKVKMSYAIRLMMNRENQYQQRYKISSKMYSSIIAETKSIIGNSMTGINNPFYGKTHSIETSQKMKQKRALQVMPNKKGKIYSEETLARWREANKKQFEDPMQIELRRTKCNKIQGMKIYHNTLGETKYFVEGTQPSGWVKGRVIKSKGGSNVE